MTKFMKVIDEEFANKCLLQGLKLLNKDKIDNKDIWVFVVNKKLNFSKEEKTKFILTNRLNF